LRTAFFIRARHNVLCLNILVWLAAGSASADVYKCPDPAGKQKFQDTPCTDGTRLKVRPAMGDADPAAPRQASAYPRSSSDPMVGMGKNSLINALGTPNSSVTSTDFAGNPIESLTFIQHGKAIVAYLKNGFVFSTNSIEKDWIRQPGSTANNCASAIDIRNAETSANSISLTDQQKRERRYEIERMKACLLR